MRSRALLIFSLLTACPDAPRPDDARLKAGVDRLEALRAAELPDADLPAPLDLARALSSADELKAATGERAVVAASEALAEQLHKDGAAAHDAELKALAALPRTRPGVRLAMAKALVAAAKESLLRMDPSNAALYARLAREADETQSGAYQVLGELAFQQGEVTQALQLYDTGLLRDPNDAELKALAERRRQEAKPRRASDHFTLDGDEDPAAGLVLDALEEAYRTVGAVFDLYPEEKLSVTLYPNRPYDPAHRHPGWAAGSYDGKLRLHTQGALAQKASLKATVFHEYAHALFRLAAGGTAAPAWVNEGLAELAADKAGAGSEVTCAVGHALPLHLLEKSFSQLEQRQTRAAYLEARHAFERLMGKYSLAKVRTLFAAMKERQDFDRAFEKTFGQSVSAFSNAFDAEVGSP
jgi:hypothetical protein